MRREYSAADRRRKSKLLDGLVEATGYNRKYANWLLVQIPTPPANHPRTRRSRYGRDVVDAVRQLWKAGNGICAKRLRPFLPVLIETLERFEHLKLDRRLKKKIVGMSHSTLERMLRKERDKESKGKSLTRPGSMLRKQVAVKTFAEWNDQEIGFFEVDLVAHCGGDISGRFMQTLTMTDIATGWTEIVPLPSKAETHVRAGIQSVIKLLPFKLKGIDCDNGKEFLNHGMVAWCKAREITFTRSRAYRKNDQAHVEEKNGSVVRRLVGYERFEGRNALAIMAELYSISRLYINYFQPSMKLVKKTRIGAKVSKQYDTAKTPLERLTCSKTLSKKQTNILLSEFRALDPLRLLAEMNRLQAKLWQVHLTTANESVSEIPSKKTKPTQQYSIPKRATRKQNKLAKREKEGQDERYARFVLTQDFVDNVVHARSGQQIIHRDKKLIGFGLRVSPGSKSFIAETRVNGIARRVTIGRADLFSVEEARNEACRLLRQMKRGIEPLRLRKNRKSDD